MTKSVTKIQDKDTRKRLSVVRSKEDPTKYWVVILNPDWSRIRGPKWETGDAATVEVWYTCTGEPGTSACVTNSWDCHHATFNFTIPEWQQGEIGPTWNGICCTTCSKVWKTTTVQFDYTNWTDFCFSVQDGQDWVGAWDMLACVYDPCNCAKDTFDYDNFYNTPDLTCYQEKLTAWNNITINANTISWDYNYAEPTTAASCGTKCVCIPEITQLCPGQTIIIKPTITATNCATNLKLNSFDAYPVRYNNAALTSTTDGYVWWANQLAQLVFDWSYRHVVSKSYDANTTYTMNYSVDAWKHKAGSGSYAISRYSLVLQKDDWTWETLKDTSTNYSTATTKTVNTHWFRLWEIRYYNTTTVVANGGLIATNTLNNKAASVDMRYSTNCGGTTDWAEWDYIYLVGTIWNDWLFYLDTTKWWSNTLPSAKDNKVYIRLWIALAAAWYTMSLLDDRPIYYYDNGIKVYWQADNKADKSSLGTAAYCNTWTCCWEVPVLDSYWKLCTSILPWVALTDTFVVANKSDLTSLSSAEQWDIWIVTAESKTYVLSAGPYSTEANWKELLSPTDAVTSVNGQTGAVCINIPTDNCELCNGCGYTTCTWTVSSCADIISKLWYTPYSSANPNWYTSCTGTLVPSNIACINGCCLTNWGDVCIQWWEDYSWVTKTISGWEVELWLRTIVNPPTSDFTLTKPVTLKEWEEYVIRTISETSYCMCLGSCFTNPWNVNTCLSGNATDQYVFLAIWGELELQPLIDTWS
jgi:hypothetical protein